MADKKDNFVDYVVHVNRVTKVTKGGKRFSYSVLVVSGDKKGNVGISLGKSKDVSLAVAKGTTGARKNLISVPLRGVTLPHDVEGKHGASRVIIRPASKGTGVIAGGAVRAIMEALGVKDVLAKSFGENPQNVAKAALNALAKLRTIQQVCKLRGKDIQQLIGEKNVAVK